MIVCPNHNCQLEKGHKGWHALYHYGTENRCIEWMKGKWRNV